MYPWGRDVTVAAAGLLGCWAAGCDGSGKFWPRMALPRPYGTPQRNIRTKPIKKPDAIGIYRILFCFFFLDRATYLPFPCPWKPCRIGIKLAESRTSLTPHSPLPTPLPLADWAGMVGWGDPSLLSSH